MWTKGMGKVAEKWRPKQNDLVDPRAKRGTEKFHLWKARLHPTVNREQKMTYELHTHP